MNNNTNFEAMINGLNEFSVVELRAMKLKANEIIKIKLETEATAEKVTKAESQLAARAAGAEFIKTTKAGDKITVNTSNGPITMEISKINLEKSTVSGYPLNDAGEKVLREDGKVKTLWRYFEDIVIAAATADADDVTDEE